MWNELSFLEQNVLEFIVNNNGATREEASSIIGRSKTTTISLLNRLIDKKIIVWTGTSKKDKFGKYILK